MPTPIVIIDEFAGFYRSRLAPGFLELEFRAFPERREVKAAALVDAQAIFAKGTHAVFDDELLAAAPKLKWIQALTTGTDAIVDLKTLARQVVITSNTGIHGPQMSETAFMHMLNLSRNALRFWENQKAGRWERWTQIRLAGKTVLILGVGAIAEALAPRCKAFGMTVLGVSATPREVPGFDRIHPRSDLLACAARADYVVVLLPATPPNIGLLDAKFFAAMKPTAYLVNIGRGVVCDEQALIEALRNRRIAGAGLDHFARLPLAPDHPLWRMENVLVTPNIAGGSDVNHLLNLPILEKNIRCFIEGRLEAMVNRVQR
ncbi:MAG: D-2-hydroxyacid dehydrogenase [Burkholderiales bacterium]|nr:D-2-hydroxyacid dehydrogenase [Burkholderiales bacterium]